MSKLPLRRASLCIVAFTLAACQALFAAEVIPAPLDLGKDIAGYVVAPSVNKLLDNADAVVKQFAPPEQYQPGMLKMLLGAQLGDPTLANMGNKPAVLLLFKLPAGYNPQAGTPPMALYIPANAASPYDQVFNQGGVTTFDDGLLIAAPNADTLKQAQAAKAVYAKIAAADIKSDLRMYVSVSSLMENFSPMVKGALAQAEQKTIANIGNTPPPPGIDIKPETAIKLVKAALRGAQGFVNQADGFQIDLKLSANTFELDEEFIAKDGSVLAALLTGGPGQWNKNLEGLVGKGAMAGMGSMDTAAFAAGWKRLVEEIAKDPEIADLAQEDVVKQITDGIDAMGGNSIFSMNVGADGSLNASSAGTVKDEAKYQKLFSMMSDIFKADGFLSKAYATMGIKLDSKIEVDARERKGVKISRMSFTMDMPQMPAAQRENMKKWMKPTEFTLVKGFALSSNNPETMDQLIDKATSGDFTPMGMELKSKAFFGEGLQMYLDYDVFAVMKAVVGADPNNPAAPVFAKLTDGEPLLLGYGYSEGRGISKIGIPLGAVAKMVKQFQEMGKNLENGGPPKPKATEEGKF